MALAGELLAQQSYDFNLLCRYCLKKTSELNKIFDHGLNTAKYCSDSSKPSHGASSAEIEDVPLHMALIECTQIEVTKNEEMPRNICTGCTCELRRAFTFKQMCAKSDEILRQYIKQRKTLKQIVVAAPIDFESEISVQEVRRQSVKSEKLDLKINEYSSCESDYVDQLNDVSDLDAELEENGVGFHNKTNQNQTAVATSWDKPLTRLALKRSQKGNPTQREGMCKICDQTFDRVPSLRSHLKWHARNVDSFENIQLQRLVLFCDIKNVTTIEAIAQIQSELQVNEWQKYFQLTNIASWEMELSDSDTDSDEDSENTPTVLPAKLRSNVSSKDSPSQSSPVPTRTPPKKRPSRPIHSPEESPSDSSSVQTKSTPKKRSSTRPKASTIVPSISSSPKANASDEKSFTCEVCLKNYQRIDLLKRHQRLHRRTVIYYCDMCTKEFYKKPNLKSHMRVHVKVKPPKETHPFLCVYCGNRFAASSNLTVHMRRHTGEKPYKCDLCNKAFPRSCDLLCHRRTHTGEKPCLCTICGMGFSRKNKLTRHMRIHTGTRPYKCNYCDRAFTQTNDLTLHIRRHTGEKPYVCGDCGERFIQGTALRVHFRQTGHLTEVKRQMIPTASVNYSNNDSVDESKILSVSKSEFDRVT